MSPPALSAPERFRHGELTVLYDPMPGPLTAIGVVITVGSRHDGRYPGLAHMTEHMLFQGTRRLDQLAINRRAGELGGEHDADTGYDDMTLHFEIFNEDVEDALYLLADQLFASTVPDARFEKERRVVIDEIRGRREDPVNTLHEQAWRRFFGDAFGHPICGTVESLRRLTPAVVRGFLRRHFQPGRMVLGVSGGVTAARLRRAVARAFPRRAGRSAPRLRRPPTLRTGMLRLRREDLPQAYLIRLARVPSDHRRQLALQVALEIVGADPDARLFQEVRERLGLGYDVGASLEVGPDWAATVLSASAAREQERRLVDTVEHTCRDATRGFSHDEVRRAHRKLRYRFARLQDARLDRALAHATRAAMGQPSLPATMALLARLEHAEVEAAWREMMRAPTLTAVLSS
ncbi:MAG TPA: pitrilysin family protein [Candidatus Limnocylindria bacterium]|nr:pitrilysin family protein [Candidatus Limnocylindria bacterium]